MEAKVVVTDDPSSTSKTFNDSSQQMLSKNPSQDGAALVSPGKSRDDGAAPYPYIEAAQTHEMPPGTPVPESSSHFVKRKRESSVNEVTNPLLRSSSKSQTKQPVSRTYSQKGKGGAKAKGKQKEADKTNKKSEDAASNSSASSTSRLLQLKSGNTSRASSVASSSSSRKSSPSPTVAKQVTVKRRPIVPPLLHTHSHARSLQHHHHPPPSTPQPQRATQRTLSFSRPSESPVASASTSFRPVPSHRPAPSSNSPVTRSNCRYHKISLPLDEDGPRVFFLVPGCSLGDKELMDEEEIEDHGDATTEDSSRMIPDIESLDFNSYLIGVLRQLVGVDLLREQEVYYLPQPGEKPIRKVQHRKHAVDKSGSSKLSTQVSGSELGTVMVSPRTSNGSIFSPTSSRAPASFAGSTEVSPFKAKASEKEDSSSDLSLSEDESDEEEDGRKPKRARASPPTTQGSPLTARRSQRLNNDATTYKPERDAEEESTDDQLDTPKTRRKLAAQRGIKRARASDAKPGEEDPESRKAKKSRSEANGST